MKKAINLMELVIAIILLALIVFGTTAFQYSNTKMFNYSEDRARLINEANLILDRIAKDGALAIGDIANPPFFGSANSSATTAKLIIRLDTTGDGRLDAQDLRVTYTNEQPASPNPFTLVRVDEELGTTQTISSRVVSFNISPEGGNPPTSFLVMLTLRHNVAVLARSDTNPEVTVQTRVVSSSFSIH
jgi:hypothetical protein